MENEKKAVIYARYSPGSKQTEQSIEGQERDCLAFANANGYTTIGKYYDKGLTGKTDKRPEFQRMIKDSYKQIFQYVIVWQLDRFARNKYESAIHKNTLKKNDIKVLSAKENISDDPTGILMETMLEGMAEYYSAELRVKVKRGMNESFLKGLALGGTRVYGYDIVDKHFVVNEKEAKIIRKIFDEFASGKLIKDINKWLNDNKIYNKLGRPFLYNQVITILKNKKYIGTYTFADHERQDVIPPIVDKAVFDLAQKRIEKHRMKPASLKAREQYLLTHKVFCGYCEQPLIADCGTNPQGNIYRYYKCTNKKKSIQPCDKKQVNKEWLENTVVNCTNDLLTDEFIIRAAKQLIAYNKKADVNTKLAHYEKELAEVQKKLNSYLDAIEKGLFNNTTQSRMLELESQKADLEHLIDEEKLDTPLPLVEEEVIFWLSQFQNGDINDLKFRERLIDTFVNKIIIYNDKMIIVFNVREQDNEKLTVKEIIDDFAEYEKTNPKEFEFVRDGAW